MKKIFGKRKRAFTLAEVLITLLIIGVVAAITIPILMNSVNEKALSKQRDVTSKKFTEGLRQMRVDGVLNQKFATTQDFVNEMKKYFKINGTCNSDNLNACFPAQTITGTYIDANDSSNNKEEVYDNVNTLTLETIASKTGQKFDKYSNLMGVTMQDGMSLLIAVNTDCIGPAEGDTQSAPDSCIAYIADVNNAKSPNKEGKDIYANIFLVKQPIQIVNNKVYTANAEGSFKCSDGGTDSCWGAAKAFCESQGGHLPDFKELRDIAVLMGYNCPESSGDNVNCTATDNLKPYGDIDILSNGLTLWLSSRAPNGILGADYGIFSPYNAVNGGASLGDGTVSAMCVK